MAGHVKSINDVMPMIGARFYTQLDATQVRCDVLQGELAKVTCYRIEWRISVFKHKLKPLQG